MSLLYLKDNRLLYIRGIIVIMLLNFTTYFVMYVPAKKGIFEADMKVSLINDSPTIIIEFK